MNLLDIAHMAIVLFIVGIPFLPVKILKTAIYLPLLISLSWVLFGGCFITKGQYGVKSESFVFTALNKLFPSITLKQSDSLVVFVMIAVTFFGSKRLCNF